MKNIIDQIKIKEQESQLIVENATKTSQKKLNDILNTIKSDKEKFDQQLKNDNLKYKDAAIREAQSQSQEIESSYQEKIETIKKINTDKAVEFVINNIIKQ